MMNNEFFYCYGVERNSTDEVRSALLIKVEQNADTQEWCGCELLPPMSLAEISQYKVENLSVEQTEQEFTLCKNLLADRLPNVYIDENGLVRLTLKAFESKYHRLNPKRLWPSKTALFRTVTVLGETVSTCKKYITYWMTNRKIQLLDENHTEYGYFVCDFNGAVAYLTFAQMKSIGNRYSFTNAKISGERITALDGSLLPQFAPPKDSVDIRNLKSTAYVQENDNSADFEITVLRQYADSFFVLRRQLLKFDENSPADIVKNELSELVSSVEVFHQALIWESVPSGEYNRIKMRLQRLFSDDKANYEITSREILSRIICPFFKPTTAFYTMLEKCGSDIKRVANLQTMTALSRDILYRYCAILLTEQEITNVLMKMGEEYGYELFGLDYRIKSPDSLYEKLYERSNDTNKSFETLFEESRDILRYTVCFNDEEDYSKNIIAMLKSLMDKYSGQMECFRNYWTPYVSGEYKGINVSLRLPEMCWDMRENRLRGKQYIGSRYCITVPSFCFEVQFHTQMSLSVKEHNHKLYERNRRAGVSPEERQQNNAEMKKNIAAIVTPSGAEYLNMMSNEYIEALQNSIQLMQKELREISDQNNPYINNQGLLGKV